MKPPRAELKLEEMLNVRVWLSAQPIDATHVLNLATGVSKFNVCLGRF
jgi:hypothetical protein